MSRSDISKERRSRLEPSRLDFAKRNIEDFGYEVEVNGKELSFIHRGSNVKYFPYTGWATGKSIKDGRGLENLIQQLDRLN